MTSAITHRFARPGRVRRGCWQGGIGEKAARDTRWPAGLWQQQNQQLQLQPQPMTSLRREERLDELRQNELQETHKEKKSGAGSQRGKESLAGIISGVISRVVVSPLDVLKIRFQLQISKQDGYSGIVQSARKIFNEEGVRGLWKGTMPSLFLWGAYSGIQFPVYHDTLHFFGHTRDSAPWTIDLVAGASGSFAATALSYPLDTLRTQLVYRQMEHRSVLALTKHIYVNDGFSGFFRGFVPTVTQVVPGMALSFAFYGFFRRHIVTPKSGVDSENAKISPLSLAQTLLNLCSGSLAGMLSKIFVHPLDTVKKRIQVNHLLERSPEHQVRYKGMLHCIQEMYIHEGVRSFFSGLSPTLLKSAVSTAFTFTIYDYTLALLNSGTWNANETKI